MPHSEKTDEAVDRTGGHRRRARQRADAGVGLDLLFALLHGAGNGILTIAKGTLPLAIFGPAGYGLRQGVLMVPARIGQAGAPFLFAFLMERFGAASLLLSTALGLAGLAALLALAPAPAERRA
jgi:hypothetical protein